MAANGWTPRPPSSGWRGARSSTRRLADMARDVTVGQPLPTNRRELARAVPSRPRIGRPAPNSKTDGLPGTKVGIRLRGGLGNAGRPRLFRIQARCRSLASLHDTYWRGSHSVARDTCRFSSYSATGSNSWTRSWSGWGSGAGLLW